MGKHTRHHRYWPSRYPIFPSNMDDLPFEACWESEYPNDDYTDTRQFSLGRPRHGRLEYLGRLPCDGMSTRVSVEYGNIF
jgi:hypothetical protein